MSEIKKLTDLVVAFRDARDWKQFHNPKDLSISLSLEASEVLEHFQWKNKDEIHEYVKTHRDKIGDELADVLYWVLLLSHETGIDLIAAFERKMKENDEKYPIDKAKGQHTKYSQL